MIRVNDFLADFEAHHAPPSNLKYQTSAARAGLGENHEDADCVEALFGKYLESSKRSCEASRFGGARKQGFCCSKEAGTFAVCHFPFVIFHLPCEEQAAAFLNGK